MDWYDIAWDYYLSTFDEVGPASFPAEWQRELVALMLVNREVNNGGYLQFFANHGREVYSYASQALRAIRARRMAEIIDCCQTLLDEHTPGDWSPDEREAVLPESVLSRVCELPYVFMNYPDDVGNLAQASYGPLIEADRQAEPGAAPDPAGL